MSTTYAQHPAHSTRYTAHSTRDTAHAPLAVDDGRDELLEGDGQAEGVEVLAKGALLHGARRHPQRRLHHRVQPGEGAVDHVLRRGGGVRIMCTKHRVKGEDVICVRFPLLCE